MNILILSANTGGGHNSAAKALKAEFEKRGHSAKVKNALDFVPKTKDLFVTRSHELLYKYMPDIYGLGYRFEEEHSTFAMYLDYAQYAPKVIKYLQQRDYDAVVCVHIFAALMMTKVRKSGYYIPQYFISTDYTCSPGVEWIAADSYFVPKMLTREFVMHGIAEKAIIESGIPVDSRCYIENDRKALRKSLKVAENARLIIIGAGAIGCGPIREIANELRKECGGEVCIRVLCGNNKLLYERLLEEADGEGLAPVGYTDRMINWIKAADVMVTKPGGLTSTEAASCRTPLFLVESVPGPETHNLKYFVERNFACTGESIEEIVAGIKALLEDGEKRDSISKSQAEWFNLNSVGIIADEISRA